MAPTGTVRAPQKPLEDLLAHLPCSTIQEFQKSQVIYGQEQSTSVYLVVEGKVTVSRLADDGQRVIVDIYRVGDFFGESAFLNLTHGSEHATALDNSRVMAWPTAEIEEIIAKRPRLAIALLQLLAQRILDFTHRIESFSVDTIERRLARSLIRFSERLGMPEKRLRAHTAFLPRVAISIRGHHARDRHSLHEPVPAPGLRPLFAQGDHPAPRYPGEWLRQDFF